MDRPQSGLIRAALALQTPLNYCSILARREFADGDCAALARHETCTRAGLGTLRVFAG